ncbi:MAG: hypothetical protein HYZ44_11595 [Bacteroidetes bacterium]|nr:hypothetical protein [Bacteroidota bacterium]
MQKSSFRLKIAKAIFVLIASVLASCGDSVTPIASEDYFPLKIGSQWIYSMEESSTLRNLCADDGVTNSSYELKVVITDSYANAEGGTTYVFERSKRTLTTDPWTPIATWTAQRRGSKLIANESNVLYVKLLFPVAEEATWNGNEFNTEIQLNNSNVDSYQMINVHQPYSLSSTKSYPKSVTVIQNNEVNNVLRLDVRKEVYALGVGLVYKESNVLKYFSQSQDGEVNFECYLQKRVQNGTTLKQTLKEFSTP